LIVSTIGRFPPFGRNYRTLSTGHQPTSQKVKTVKKYHIYFAARQTHTKKKRLATALIATPDEILWKGLEMGGFNH
jgi:hypothetical protein